MRTLTILSADGWESAWLDDELATEGHSVSFYAATCVVEDAPFVLVYKEIEGSKADDELMNAGGFRGIALDKWLSLAKEPA